MCGPGGRLSSARRLPTGSRGLPVPSPGLHRRVEGACLANRRIPMSRPGPAPLAMRASTPSRPRSRASRRTGRSKARREGDLRDRRQPPSGGPGENLVDERTSDATTAVCRCHRQFVEVAFAVDHPRHCKSNDRAEVVDRQPGALLGRRPRQALGPVGGSSAARAMRGSSISRHRWRAATSTACIDATSPAVALRTTIGIFTWSIDRMRSDCPMDSGDQRASPRRVPVMVSSKRRFVESDAASSATATMNRSSLHLAWSSCVGRSPDAVSTRRHRARSRSRGVETSYACACSAATYPARPKAAADSLADWPLADRRLDPAHRGRLNGVAQVPASRVHAHFTTRSESSRSSESIAKQGPTRERSVRLRAGAGVGRPSSRPPSGGEQPLRGCLARRTDSVTRANPSSNDPSGSEPNQSCSRVRRTASAGSPAEDHDVSKVAADYMVDQDHGHSTRHTGWARAQCHFSELLGTPVHEKLARNRDALPRHRSSASPGRAIR